MASKYIFIKNNKGFGLLEVLISLGLTSIMFMAINKGISISLKSASVTDSLLLDQDLKHAIAKSFESHLSCEKNILSGNTLTALKYHSSPSVSETLLAVGISFKKKLQIVKMGMKDTPGVPSNKGHKTFTVFYKRKGLGVLSTKDQKDCTTTDQSGCYKSVCQLIYKTSPSMCSLLNCSTGSKTFISSIVCDPGEYIERIDPNGIAVCVPVVERVKTVEVKTEIKKTVGELRACNAGEYVRGFRADGSLDCRSLPPPPPVPVVSAPAPSSPSPSPSPSPSSCGACVASSCSSGSVAYGPWTKSQDGRSSSVCLCSRSVGECFQRRCGPGCTGIYWSRGSRVETKSCSCI